MPDQHRATDEQWALVEGTLDYSACSCLLELRDRIQLLEATQHAHIETKASDPYSGRPSSLTDDQRKTAAALAGARCAIEQLRSKPGSWRPAEPAGDDQPVQQFIAKYLFTAGNILQDSFRFDFNNSVLFDLCINDEHLAPGDGIKIAHRLGEVPASGVYSTINYKVASVSKVDDGAWTIRAVRVDTSDSEPAPTADDLDAVAAAGAQGGRSSAAVDRVRDLQDQILDGSLSLAGAVKEINSEPEPADDARRLTLVDGVADAIGAADDEGLTNMTWRYHSRAAIREVAARINERQQRTMQPSTADEIVGWLRDEAERW
jgi:hypothetical protein